MNKNGMDSPRLLCTQKALAQTCKAFQPLKFYERLIVNLGSCGDLEALNSILHKHDNCIRKLMLVGHYNFDLREFWPAPLVQAVTPAFR